MQVVRQTLAELGAHEKPTLLVFNKVDVLAERGLVAALKREHPDAVFVSALRGIGLDRLKTRLVEVAESDYVERAALLPVEESRARAHIHRVAEVLDEAVVVADDDETVARLDADAQRRVLAAALGELRPQDREILLLHAWAELSDSEIGAALSLPTGTVKSRLHRTRERLRNHLDRQGQVAVRPSSSPAEDPR